MKKHMITENIVRILQGALVGVGAILPGVSGGVLCVAFGVYEPMMELLTSPARSWKTYYGLFVPFGLGWVLGFILLARGVEALFAVSASAALMLFFGLICGTLPELMKASEQSEADKSWTPFVLSLALAYLFFHLLENGSPVEMTPNFGGFLLCGVLWGLSLIIPGFSSSSILIYLGLYEPMTAGIGSVDLAVILPMFLGIGVTAALLARLVNMLYKKHYAVTSRIVLGFVIASSLKIVPGRFSDVGMLLVSVACFAVGFALARGMDLAGKKQQSRVEEGEC